MNNNNIRILPQDLWPSTISKIPDPPDKLFIRGELPPPDTHYICIVGSRAASPYGKDICERLIQGLVGHPITIVSGLALGIDTCAHQNALQTGLRTIAFPGSGLADDVIYPRNNYRLAHEIIDSGGALISEYERDTISRPWVFPQRNRLMAALCELVIIIECSLKSGSLLTARLALDYNKQIGVVPGSVFSRNSAGPHYLLRQGAAVIESSDDILELLGIKSNTLPTLFDDLPSEEKQIIEILAYPMTRDELFEKLDWPAHQVQTVLAKLEIKGIIEERLGEVRLRNC